MALRVRDAMLVSIKIVKMEARISGFTWWGKKKKDEITRNKKYQSDH